MSYRPHTVVIKKKDSVRAQVFSQITYTLFIYTVFTGAVCRQSNLDEAETGSCYPEELQFECGNGQCINTTLQCNAVADCLSGEDESMQLCGKREQY